MSSNGNVLTNGKAARKRRRRLILGSILVLVLIGGGYGVYAALRPNHVIDPSKLAMVEKGDLAKVVVATGKIQPRSKVEVKSKSSGMVKQLLVDYDDRVKQGQTLVELDKVQLQAVYARRRRICRRRRPRGIRRPPSWNGTRWTRRVRMCRS